MFHSNLTCQSSSRCHFKQSFLPSAAVFSPWTSSVPQLLKVTPVGRRSHTVSSLGLERDWWLLLSWKWSSQVKTHLSLRWLSEVFLGVEHCQYIHHLFGFLRYFYTFLESLLKEQEAAKWKPDFVSQQYFATFGFVVVVVQNHKYPVYWWAPG